MVHSDWECPFCLAVIEDLESPPDLCERCEMVRCMKCLTWLKERGGKKSKFCHGCGSINPETRISFSRTSNTSCCYMEKEWRHRNKGKQSDGEYTILTGFHTLEDRKKGKAGISSWISKLEDGKYVDVRELTDEEKAIIKGD